MNKDDFKRDDMRKRQNFFYQSLNLSRVVYTPTCQSKRVSINQLHSTLPINDKQKQMIHEASQPIRL
jgi:hypothetical protein